MLISDRVEPDKLLNAINMLKVIAHPVRLSMLDLLTEKQSLTVMEIQEALRLEQAIASQHITLMEDKGVLLSEKVGRNKFVSLRFPNMKKIVECLEGCCQKG